MLTIKGFHVLFFINTHTTNGELKMKKMLSLAAMLAVLSYASPASAELKIGGDFSVRARAEFNSKDPGNNAADDLMFQYRLRLNGAADLGDGYFFKTMLMSEEPFATSGNAAGGWRTVGGSAASFNVDAPYSLSVSQAYFGRNLKDSNYKIGRIPLNSFNNPIFDLTLYPTQPLDTPVNNYGYDRLFGANYGTKVGDGTLNATLVVLDNSSNDVAAGLEDNGFLNDGYALSLAYAFTAGDVTIEPQIFAVLTNADVNLSPTTASFAPDANPFTFGAMLSTPVGNSKISGGAFYTSASEKLNNLENADYSGYLIRVKGESGPFMAWIDYNKTTDDLAGAATKDYTNTFLWAQYKHVVYKGAASSFSLQPTLRYRAQDKEVNAVQTDTATVRGELVATVTF
jgi:hypothetical protein